MSVRKAYVDKRIQHELNLTDEEMSLFGELFELLPRRVLARCLMYYDLKRGDETGKVAIKYGVSYQTAYRIKEKIQKDQSNK